ncbi:hypothetical protein ABLO27_17545 [Roseibium sp. SCPC15]|uniref:hypothetical protein n=1 Tax=Roseibium sp. SCP15 TaxID=3141376 RepID=UPI00333A4C71
MARLQKFEGTTSLPGVGSPQVVADTAVGEAVAGLGRQIGNTAGTFGKLADLARRRQQRIDEFEAEKADMKVNRRLKGNLGQELLIERPGGVGLTEAMLIHLEKGREEAQKELSEEAKVRFNQEIEANRERYASSFAAVEAAENEKYFQRGMGEVEDRLVAEVQDDPEVISAAIERADAILTTMPLPATVKTSGLNRIKENLAEAWTKSRPVQEQIDGLTKLKSRRDAGVSADTSGKGSAGAGPRTVSSEMSVFESRAQFLSPHTQNRLLADAKKKQAVATVQEEERIATLIAENPLAMNPQEIHESGFLEAHQQKRLLDDLQEQIRQQERDLEAVSWLGASAAEPTHESSNQELADRAFAYLDDGKTDRDALALGMLRNKGVLPDVYLKSLENTLNSSDPAEVGKAFDILAEIGKVDPKFVEGLRGHEQFRSGVEKQDILLNRFGFSLRETSADLAQANDPVRRKDLRTDFAGQYPQGRTGRARAQGRLAHHSASGYGSSPIPVDELLSGIDFVERGGNSAGEIQVAGNSAGLAIPGGLPLVTPLDPDKPSGFYGGATPNEAATSALPYLRFMSDLMNPSATASELFNKGNETTGGKKSADNGKNEQHGDGGRRIQKIGHSSKGTSKTAY